MRLSIRNKLTITYLLISLITALLIYILTYFTSEQRVNSLALNYQTKEMVQEVYHWYAAEQTWKGFPAYFKALHPPIKEQPKAIAPTDNLSKRHGLIAADNTALLRYRHFERGEYVPQAYLKDATAISYNEQIIAWIIPPDSTGINLNTEMQVFLDNIREVMFIAICIGVFISLLMGMLLAKIMMSPVELLTKASVAIANGQLQQKVNHYADDEIGDLSRAFNKMSHDLFVSDKQRRQMTADITHDLGSPVQVISGYIEMAEEGFNLTPESLDIISCELEQINRLLSDMNLLAQTDAKTLSLQLTSSHIQPILQRVTRLYQKKCTDKKVTLNLQCDDNLPKLLLDEERIVQVIANLLTNALRYTPEDGCISISACKKTTVLEISVTDTGSGITAADLPFVFDRFYRSSESRSETTGNMGLGLAISKGLIEMHNGEITVYSNKGQGTRFVITLPLH